MGGYQIYHGVKEKALKGGCGLYVKEGIKFQPTKDLEITYSDKDNEFPCSWIELLNEKRPIILVGVHYRHPKKKSGNLFSVKLKKNTGKITFTGNFNYDIFIYEKSSIISEF